EDEYGRAERHSAGHQPLDQGRLSGTGLAEDKDARVGDEPGAQPGQWIEADDLAPELVASNGGADGRGAAARYEREQAAQLSRGCLVLRTGRHVDGSSASGDLPSPRRWKRYPVAVWRRGAVRLSERGRARPDGGAAGLASCRELGPGRAPGGGAELCRGIP